MKKLISFVLIISICVIFSSCAVNKNNVETSEDNSWNKVESKGYLTLGLDDTFPPMGYKDVATGEIIGFDVDLAREVCNRLGIGLKLQPIDWDNKQIELENGNVDCLWNGFSKTPEREEKLNLSIPYMTNKQIILVKKDSEYENLNDLAGKILGVQSDSSAEFALKSEKNSDFRKYIKKIVSIDNYSKAVLEIQNNTIDAIAIDEVVATFYLKNNPDAYRILQDENGNYISLENEDYVVAFRKNDDELKEKINETMVDMAQSGTMAQISNKWFGEDITVVNK